MREASGLVRITSGTAIASRSVPSTMPDKVKNAFAAVNVTEDDLLYISYPLVHEGENLNRDVFLPTEMSAGFRSLVGTPLDKDHKQGVDDIVGQHFAASLDSEADGLIINCDAYVYANLYPDIVIKLQDGSINAVSMETAFEWADRMGDGSRVLHGLTFIGAGLVRIPADPKALIQLNAEKPSQAYSKLITPQDKHVVALVIASILQGVHA